MRSIALGVAFALAAVALTGCGGSGEASLQEGVYESTLTPEYMVQGGLSQEQADNESGVHELTLANGSFSDRWQSVNGTNGFCSGTYKEDGTRVTFTWISGCFGDWAMTYTIDGDEVTWSDIEALPPHDTAEDQNAAEVFNGVPWTRVGDVPSQ